MRGHGAKYVVSLNHLRIKARISDTGGRVILEHSASPVHQILPFCRSSVLAWSWLRSGPLESQLLWVESRARRLLEIRCVFGCKR